MMTSMINSFAPAWAELVRRSEGAKKEVEFGQPIRLVYGANEAGEAVFFAISDLKPALPELSRAVRIDRGIRTIDRRWTLSFTLRDDRLADVFFALCEDLARRTIVAGSEKQALSLLLEGVSEWKILLHSLSASHLSLDEIRGLVAELWFGFKWLSSDFSPSEVLEAWTGPLAGHQDFRFAAGIAFEVKSIYPDARHVRISSAEQLDTSNGLTLVVVPLAPSHEAAPASFSLQTLVKDVERSLIEVSGGLAKLDGLLRGLSLDVLDGHYSDFWFEAHEPSQFEVSPAFPAIRASQLPDGIARVEYSISMNSISHFRLE